MNVNEFRCHVKEERAKTVKSPLEIINRAFEELGYSSKSTDFFRENASDILVKTRKKAWEDFLLEEKHFTSLILKDLVALENYEGQRAGDAIVEFVEKYPEHIYQLCLSNTQSRRSRAGKEFEFLIEFILRGAGVRCSSQGKIGKDLFEKQNLSKSVDLVVPSVLEYEIKKRDTILISAKTTLRERWQEVPEEMGRTGAREIFLATLDTTITKEVIRSLNTSNIQIVTTKSIKDSFYSKETSVISFEELIKICSDIQSQWDAYPYTEENTNLIIQTLKEAEQSYSASEFLSEKIKEQLKDWETF